MSLKTSGNSPFVDDEVAVVNASVTSALVARFIYETPDFGISTGLRAGYHLELQLADPQLVDLEGFDPPVSFISETHAHMGVLGFDLGIALGAADIYLELDGLGGWVDEGARVWEEIGVLGLGGRARLGVDIAIVSGLFVHLGGTAVAISATGTGEGERRTKDLERFRDGQIRFLRAAATVGVGWKN